MPKTRSAALLTLIAVVTVLLAGCNVLAAGSKAEEIARGGMAAQHVHATTCLTTAVHTANLTTDPDQVPETILACFDTTILGIPAPDVAEVQNGIRQGSYLRSATRDGDNVRLAAYDVGMGTATGGVETTDISLGQCWQTTVDLADLTVEPRIKITCSQSLLNATVNIAVEVEGPLLGE